MVSDSSIWGKNKRMFRISKNFSTLELEKWLEGNFQNGFAVVLSSARSGLYLLFKYFFSGDTVRVFPFASQCLVSASFNANKCISTPLPGEIRDLYHHQWGIQQQLEAQGPIFIEDSADSLYPLGGTVLKNHAMFEVWSLPKIIGTSFGGIVWCAQTADAQNLKKIRDNLGSQSLLTEIAFGILKNKSAYFYQKWETLQYHKPKTNIFQNMTLVSQFRKWESIYLSRKIRFYDANFKVNNYSFTESEKIIVENSGIIPTVVILEKVELLGNELKAMSKISSNGDSTKIHVFPYLQKVSS